jgi:hypothetical protein
MAIAIPQRPFVAIPLKIEAKIVGIFIPQSPFVAQNDRL